MVRLHQKMKKEEECPYEEDSSDSCCYSSDEEEEADSISLSSRGLRVPNGYFSRKFLEEVECAFLCDFVVHIQLLTGDAITILLPDGYDGNKILQALEEWMVTYK